MNATKTTCDGKLGFRIHAATFVPVIALLFVINTLIGGYVWAIWPLLSWGTGLLAHWWFVLGPGAKPTA